MSLALITRHFQCYQSSSVLLVDLNVLLEGIQSYVKLLIVLYRLR